MCNLFKQNRLFIVPNPCCCCALRCGTVWICLFSCIYGLVSLFLPIGLGLRFINPFHNHSSYAEEEESHENPSFDKKIILDKGESEGESDFTPDIDFTDIQLTWGTWTNPHWKNWVHFGCTFLQSLTASLLGICIMTRAGGFLNFLAGGIWMVSRVVITISWGDLIMGILHLNLAKVGYKWKRYIYMLLANVLVHFYFFLVIRYYTMECWDLWRYRPVTPELRGRKRTRPKKYQKKLLKKKGRVPAFTEDLKGWRKAQRQEDLDLRLGMAPVPIWRIHSKFIFYGEDYSGMDPVRFMFNWEKMNKLAMPVVGKLAADEKARGLSRAGGGRGGALDEEEDGRNVRIIGGSNKGQRDLITMVNEIKRNKANRRLKRNFGAVVAAASAKAAASAGGAGRKSRKDDLDSLGGGVDLNSSEVDAGEEDYNDDFDLDIIGPYRKKMMAIRGNKSKVRMQTKSGKRFQTVSRAITLFGIMDKSKDIRMSNAANKTPKTFYKKKSKTYKQDVFKWRRM